MKHAKNTVIALAVVALGFVAAGQMSPEQAAKLLKEKAAAKPTYEQLERDNARLKAENSQLKKEKYAASLKISELQKKVRALEARLAKYEGKAVVAGQTLQEVFASVPAAYRYELGNEISHAAFLEWANKNIMNKTFAVTGKIRNAYREHDFLRIILASDVKMGGKPDTVRISAAIAKGSASRFVEAKTGSKVTLTGEVLRAEFRRLGADRFDLELRIKDAR